MHDANLIACCCWNTIAFMRESLEEKEGRVLTGDDHSIPCGGESLTAATYDIRHESSRGSRAPPLGPKLKSDSGSALYTLSSVNSIKQKCCTVRHPATQPRGQGTIEHMEAVLVRIMTRATSPWDAQVNPRAFTIVRDFSEYFNEDVLGSTTYYALYMESAHHPYYEQVCT